MNTKKVFRINEIKSGLKQDLLMFLLTLLLSPVALAQSGGVLTQSTFATAINVDGPVISWPAGGWYQVQNTQDFSEVCSGFISSCEVNSPGTYKVTNHTLGLNSTLDAGQDVGLELPPVSSGIPYADGGTIRWESPFWYQVQSRTTSEFVCQGGTECVVENGDYWVTEHRPDGGGRGWLVVVDEGVDSANPPLTQETFAGSITIDGRVINWPAGGWYQVQNTQNFNEVCNGEISSCEVDSSGSYKVTNHSLGLNVTVDVPQGSGSSGLQLDGFVLSWPDDGWYQVQLADTFETVCEGGRSCELFPGTDFIVINHTTGQRETIRVGDAILPVPGQDVNSENAVQLMRQVFEIYNARAFDRRLFESAPLVASGNGVSIVDRLNPPSNSNSTLISTTNYSCGNGGTIHETIENPGINDRQHTLTYSNCQIDSDLIDGYVQYYTSSFGDDSYRFENYSVEFAPLGSMLVNGELFQSTNNRASADVERNDVSLGVLDYFIEFEDRRLQVNTTQTDYDYLVSRRCCSLADSGTRRTISSDRTQSLRMIPPGEDSEYVVEVVSSLFNGSETATPIFNAGRIRVTSVNDGSTMLFDADGGDDSTAAIALGDERAVTAYPWENWSDIFRQCCR